MKRLIAFKIYMGITLFWIWISLYLITINSDVGKACLIIGFALTLFSVFLFAGEWEESEGKINQNGVW